MVSGESLLASTYWRPITLKQFLGELLFPCDSNFEGVNIHRSAGIIVETYFL